MFWRIVRRLMVANPSRLLVILLALGAGAAVTAALLNLQVDAKRRLTTEFRAFGANAMITPKGSADTSGPPTIPETLLYRLPSTENRQAVAGAAFLYAQANLDAFRYEGTDKVRLGAGPVVITGYRWIGEGLERVLPYKLVTGGNVVVLDVATCELGEKAASQFHLRPADKIELKVADKVDSCVASQVRSFGGTEDTQVFMSLGVAQRITDRPRQVSLIQLSIPGTPKQIERYTSSLQRQFPEVDVRPIRQFTEGEAKIYNRISGLLTATVAIVLVLTGLCVMAAMTNVAMERRNDVGLMKAIGGSVRRVFRLFLVESALLGFVGGAIGAAAGIFLSIGLGKAVFGLAAQPRLIVYPVSVALTMVVAIISAYPLRRLATVRPASVFRGEA
jgi:putative ABC transport system permease protein